MPTKPLNRLHYTKRSHWRDWCEKWRRTESPIKHWKNIRSQKWQDAIKESNG